MLAGRMKLNTFLAIAGLGCATALGVGLYATGAVEDRQPAHRQPKPARVEATHTEGHPADVELAKDRPAGPAKAVTDPRRPWDAFLIARVGTNLGTKKVKDAKRGGAWKVNLYQDAGNASFNRAKVDFDRDDKWDEKWTFAADGISRKLAPADDEDYTETYIWDGASWVGP